MYGSGAQTTEVVAATPAALTRLSIWVNVNNRGLT